ncbi:flagellar biosynthetic protein FliO [Pseudomonas graminis]|uniref:Flagellar protein n=1 Tax=Pseudomonas graminis TaxID=158627 RepID=A0A1C2EC79_9PSED|nr:flagellar biosynthetic protein FliO [Pseudomonas graminis]
MRGLFRTLSSLPLLALSWAVMAADPATPAAPAATTATTAATTTPAVAAPVAGTLNGGIGGQLLQLVLGLLLVIGLIFVLAWLMRRVQRAGPAGNQVIKLVGSRALGTRDRLVLVQVGNEQVLLGVSPGSITALHVMNEPVDVPDPQSVQPEFAKRLLEALGNKGGAGQRTGKNIFGGAGKKAGTPGTTGATRTTDQKDTN